MNDTIEAKLLGKRVDAPKTYDPSILVAVPRELNREQYGIVSSDFGGIDEWHAYECSALCNNGLPVYFGLTIQYNADSEFIVESKSLKLYLNSMNMEKLGLNKKETIKEFCRRVKNDLSELLKTDVLVHYFSSHNDFSEFNNLKNFKNIYDLINEKELKIDSFTENPNKLKFNEEFTEVYWYADILRSNCKVTNQPDWGTVVLAMTSEKGIDPEGFVEYLVSFRDENHFHEEVCEMIYKRLLTIYHPSNILVKCLYTRRGGIDINPVRVKINKSYKHDKFSVMHYMLNRTVYQ